jgi:hypothetical protein
MVVFLLSGAYNIPLERYYYKGETYIEKVIIYHYILFFDGTDRIFCLFCSS